MKYLVLITLLITLAWWAAAGFPSPQSNAQFERQQQQQQTTETYCDALDDMGSSC